ncbi:hypothetical protein Tco_0450992 [Tanacetum coccineum]
MKPENLKNKSFANIQELFDKAMKRVNTFVDYRTELVEESSKKAKAEIAQESSSKRAGDELEQENAKKQKVDEDKETAELQSLIEVVPDEEEVAIDVVPLATKPPTIVDWKIHKEGKKSYYQIIRADGKSQIPVEDLDLILWGDLKTMFEPHVEDQLSMKKLEILKKNIKFRGGLLGLKDFLMILELLLLRKDKDIRKDKDCLEIKITYVIKLCHEFYSTYEFAKVCADGELQSKKIIKFRLGGRAHSFTLLEFARRLGLYQAVELDEEGFNVYFQGGLRSDENFNAQEHQNGYANVAWLIVRWMKRKGAGTQKESQICYGQFILKIARKSRVLTDDVIRSLSALIYCRDLDTTTLGVMTQRVSLFLRMPGVPRVGVPRSPTASMQDLYDRMGRIEIHQEAIERGAYNPPGYAQPQYDQQYPPPPPHQQQQQYDDE